MLLKLSKVYDLTKKAVLFAALLALGACAQKPSTEVAVLVENPLAPESVPVPYRTEIRAIAISVR